MITTAVFTAKQPTIHRWRREHRLNIILLCLLVLLRKIGVNNIFNTFEFDFLFADDKKHKSRDYILLHFGSLPRIPSREVKYRCHQEPITDAIKSTARKASFFVAKKNSLSEV